MNYFIKIVYYKSLNIINYKFNVIKINTNILIKLYDFFKLIIITQYL